MMPAAGSAYTYSYAVLGETIAWVVGWSLILEYSLVVSTVAVGWSGYASPLLMGLGFPEALTKGPALGGIANLPAIFIIAVVAGLLCVGTRESARLNTILVLIKIATLALFVAVALPAFDSANLHPFMPHGFAKIVEPDGTARGVMAAAAIIFFAFYGFDAISTAAEEAKRPERDLAIGIVGSMLVCTAIYVLVAAAAVGALPYTKFANSPEPLALILREMGQGQIAKIIAIAAVIALPTVILGFLYGQSRIFLVMARDGFLPPRLAAISSRGDAGEDHGPDRDHRRGAGRRPADRPDRGARQCGHIDCLHRGRDLHDGDAPPRPCHQTPVPHAAGVAGRAGRGAGLPLSVRQPAHQDALMVPAVECDRANHLRRLRPAQ